MTDAPHITTAHLSTPCARARAPMRPALACGSASGHCWAFNGGKLYHMGRGCVALAWQSHARCASLRKRGSACWTWRVGWTTRWYWQRSCLDTGGGNSASAGGGSCCKGVRRVHACLGELFVHVGGGPLTGHEVFFGLEEELGVFLMSPSSRRHAGRERVDKTQTQETLTRGAAPHYIHKVGSPNGGARPQACSSCSTGDTPTSGGASRRRPGSSPSGSPCMAT